MSDSAPKIHEFWHCSIRFNPVIAFQYNFVGMLSSTFAFDIGAPTRLIAFTNIDNTPRHAPSQTALIYNADGSSCVKISWHMVKNCNSSKYYSLYNLTHVSNRRLHLTNYNLTHDEIRCVKLQIVSRYCISMLFPDIWSGLHDKAPPPPPVRAEVRITQRVITSTQVTAWQDRRRRSADETRGLDLRFRVNIFIQSST